MGIGRVWLLIPYALGILYSNHIKERPIQMDDVFVTLSLLPGIDE